MLTGKKRRTGGKNARIQFEHTCDYCETVFWGARQAKFCKESCRTMAARERRAAEAAEK